MVFFDLTSHTTPPHPSNDNEKKINFPPNIKEIHEDSFWGCKSLKTIKLSKQVVAVHEKSFPECDSLIEIANAAGFPSTKFEEQEIYNRLVIPTCRAL